jgi:hypothetical protein
MTSEFVSTPDPGFGSLETNMFTVPTNLFPAKAHPSAAQSGFSVTPAMVCVTDTTFFAAPMSFIAAENIAGAVPAIRCFSKPNFLQRSRNQSMIRML